LQLLFSLFDADHDGKIAKEEIKELVDIVCGHSSNKEEIAEFMEAIDINSELSFFDPYQTTGELYNFYFYFLS
jgi:Ca2+-binding EF-hand superfamily protein